MPTKNVEIPSLTASEWLDGKDVAQEIIDLKPEGMTLRTFYRLRCLLSLLY